MTKLVLQRILASIPTLLLVVTLSFLLLEMVPGDPAEIIAGDSATPELVAQLHKELGLDKPLVERYVDYLGDLLQGDLGHSLVQPQSVSQLIGDALPPTLSLAVVALVLTVLIGVPLGFVAALRRGRLADRVITAMSSIAIAVPAFVLALILVRYLALERHWFPATGYSPIADGWGEWLKHLILPALALCAVSAAEVARQTRGALADVLEQDFIRTARANGISQARVLGKHAMKNASIPIVTVLGLQVGRILGGVVVVEVVFAIPGFGTLAQKSILSRDFPTIQGILLVTAVFVLVANLLVDISYTYFNPKLRASR